MSTAFKNGGFTDAFEEGMRFSKAYLQKTDSETWELYREQYLRFLNSEFQSTKIPKKIHQIWLGSELPEIYQPLIVKLKSLHPEWEYSLWTDREVANLDISNREFYLKSRNYGQKSDILRYEILHQFGGIYLDLDFVAVKPFDDLLRTDFFAGIAYDADPNFINAAIGSAPQNAFTQKLLEIKYVHHENESSILDTTGPFHLSRTFKQAMTESKTCVALPNTCFYPFPNFPNDRVLGEDYKSYIGHNSYACHLWHCTWLKSRKNISKPIFSFLDKIAYRILKK